MPRILNKQFTGGAQPHLLSEKFELKLQCDSTICPQEGTRKYNHTKADKYMGITKMCQRALFKLMNPRVGEGGKQWELSYGEQKGIFGTTTLENSWAPCTVTDGLH